MQLSGECVERLLWGEDRRGESRRDSSAGQSDTVKNAQAACGGTYEERNEDIESIISRKSVLLQPVSRPTRWDSKGRCGLRTEEWSDDGRVKTLDSGTWWAVKSVAWRPRAIGKNQRKLQLKCWGKKQRQHGSEETRLIDLPWLDRPHRKRS